MKIIFFDKQKMNTESVPNVDQVERKHNGKTYEWVCTKNNGYTEHYKCSRFEVERIEKEAI